MSPLGALIIVWPTSEIVLGVAKRASSGSVEVHDRGSAALLWSVIIVSVSAAILLQLLEFGGVGVTSAHLRMVALALLVAGLAVRWTAILTLGRLFNTNVAVHSDHTVVRRGLYSRIRHPSYSGLMLAFAGLGLSFGSWLSLLVVVVPVAAALSYRIAVEERALLDALGQEYRDYMSVTKRLIPWVY